MEYRQLVDAVNEGAAFRLKARLQPAGGPGDKVFPPTYEGGRYARERRRINGETVECVHLDSVQSQANRMELSLLEAVRNGAIRMPLIEVVFPSDDPLLKMVGTITHLEAPHRIADAILRDSLHGDTRFRDSEVGGVLNTASLANATGLFQYAPSGLLFGLWDSTGPLGGLGAKFQRAISSEVVAIGAEFGVKTSSRIDPLGIQLSAGPVYVKNAQTGEWTLNAQEAAGKKSLAGKDGRPSEVNHGNITPSVTEVNGGVTFDYAQQITVISLPMLRRLRFPGIEGPFQGRDTAARAVLAAMGLLASVLSFSKGLDLRTRTLLVPDGAPEWRVIHRAGDEEELELDVESTISLYETAVDEAISAGLPFNTAPVQLSPSPGLTELVRKSKEIAKSGDD